MRSFRTNSNALSKRRQTRNKKWGFDSEGLLRFDDRLYILGDTALRKELISRYYNNSLTEHFDAAKTHELLTRKYY